MMRHALGIVFAGLLLLGGGARAQTVTALQDTTCAGARSGSLTCTAGEFTVTPTFIAGPGTSQYCVSGASFVVDVQLGLSGTNADRYDIGFFIGQQGNDPRAATPGNICSAATFPTTPLPFFSANGNACGDYKAAGVSSPIVKSVKVLCTATTGTNLGIPYTLTFNQNTGGPVCTGPADVVNGAPSKCNAGSAQLNVGAAPIQVAGYVDVTKRTLPVGDAQSFAFTASGSSATPSNPTFNLTDGVTQRVFMPVTSTPGTLTITEAATTNWETTASISCTAQSGAPVITTNGATRTITVQLDTTNKAAACTITNTKKSRFTLVKSVGGRVGAADQFTVAATGGGTLTGTPSVTTTGTNTTASTTLYSTPATALTITDAMAAGSSSVLLDYLTKLSCTNAFAGSGATSSASLPNGVTTASTSITPAPGDDITCTYTNTPKPRITKAFSPTTVGVNNPSTLTLTLTNASSVTQAGVAFTDNYPAGLINSTPTGALTTCGSGTITAVAGGNSVALGGGTIPAATAAGDGSCTVTLNVTSATAGAYANTSAGASSSQSPSTGPSSNTATLNVLTVPTVAKSFSPSIIIPGGTSVLTITLTNPNATAITGATVTDMYPSGIVNTASPAGATTCAGGSVVAMANGGSVVLSGGTIPSGGSCVVTANVTTNAAGSYTNTIPVGGVTSTNAGVNMVAASATLRALAAPTISKAFSPASVGIGAPSTLTFTIANPNVSDTSNGLAFTDTYPAGLFNTSTASTTCGGTATAVNGGNTVSLSGGTLLGGASCTVTVSTTSNSAGTYNNTSGAISSTNTGTGTTASATLTTTVTKPTISKVFAPTSVAINSASVLTLTLSNSNAAALGGASFTDTYPSGLVTAATAGASTTCAGGSVTAAAGSTSLVFSGGTIPANGSCTVSINVSSTTAAAYANTSGGVATTQSGAAGTGSNTATLNVLPAPTIAKSFTAASIFTGGTSTLTLTLSNAGTATVTGAAVTDNYPAGLVNAATPNAATTCTGGSLTAAAGGGSISLAGGTIPAGGNCTVTVSVTSATVGSFTNTTGVVSASNAGNSGTASAVLTVAAKPTIAKVFTPSTIALNGTSTLTLSLTNSSGIALSAVSFADTYPSGLVNAGTATTTCTGGTPAATAGGNSVALSGATIAAGGSCTVTVNVTSTAAGSYANTASGVSSTESGSAGPASNTATLNLLAAPAVTKTFSVNPVAIGGTSVLTITLSNSNGVAIGAVALTDTYPSGIANTASPAGATSCGGTVSAAASGSSVALSGATIPLNGSCTVTVNVTTNAAGNFTNTIPVGGVTSINAGANTVAASATLRALAAPTISKAFSPAMIGVGGTSTLTFTLTNPNGTDAINGLAFTDTYPAGLVNASTAATTCGGSATALNNGNTVSLSGGSLAGGASCTVTVSTTGSTAGTYLNTSGAVSSTNAGNGGTASATLAVVAKPTIAKAFSPSSVALNGASTLTFTLTNSNSTPLTGASFSDTYPSGLVNAGAAATTTCASGALVAAAGSSSVALSGATIPANGSCTVAVGVSSASAGSYVNTAGGVSSTESGSAGPGSNAATLNVLSTPTVAKNFGPTSISAGGTSVLTITLSNPNTSPITGIAFTDNYPAGLVSTATPAATTTCSSGVATAAANGSSVAFSGGIIAAGTSCTITVNVTAGSTGSFVNTIAAGAVTTTNAGSNTVSASATLRILSAPTIAKSFSPATIGVGGTSALTFTLTNPNASDALTGLAFSDTYPSNLLNTNPAAATTNCSGSLTAADGGSMVSLTGGALAAGASCTITVSTTSATAGTYNNTSGTVSSSNGGTGNAASASLTVIAKPTIAKAFSPGSIAPGGSTTLTLTLTNNSSVALSGVAFTDNYPAGLANTAGAASTTCASGTVSAVAGGGSVALTGATLPGNGTCTVTVGVMSSASGGALANTSGGVSSTQSGSAGSVSNTATLNLLAAPLVAKSFGAASISIGGTTSLTITLTNSNTTTITGAAFTDTYPTGLINAPAPSTSSTCGTGTANATAGGTNLVLSGGSIGPNSSCTVKVNVSANTAGNLVNNTGPVTTGNASPGASASATLIVAAPPGIAKVFTPSATAAGAASTLTLTITNSSAVAQSGVSFNDTYPSGLVNAATPALSNSCGGTVAGAIAGGNFVGLNGGTIAANGSCTVTIQVVAATGGNYLNTTGPVSSSNGGSGNTASATLTVTNKPTVVKSFSPTTITTGGTSTLTLVITNQATQALSNVSITDNFPLNLTAVGGVTTNTCSGTISGATTGSTSFSLSGGSLGASGTCTISVPVTATIAATYDNTSTGVSSTESGSAGPTSNTARLSVLTPPSLTKSFSPAAIGGGGSSTLTLTITNTNSTALNGVGVIDTYPANLNNSGAAVSSNSCGGAPTVTANSLSLAGASVAPNSSCSVSVVVTSSTPASYVNTTNPVTSTNGGTGNAATATLTVSGNPSISKAFSPTVIPSGGTSTVTFVIANSSVVDVTPASFSDTLPVKMTVAATPAISNTCGGTITAIPGSSSISLAGGSIPHGANCSISVNITVSAAGSYNNVTSAVTNGLITGSPSNTATLVATSPATIVKAFNPTTIQANNLSTITFTVNNPNPIALTGMAFTDTFPAGGLQVAPIPNVSNGCGGTINNATAGSVALSLSGGTLAANASCTISVVVTSPIAGTFSNATSAVTSNQTSAGSGANAVLLTVVAPNLRVKKTHTGLFTIGQTGTYNITVDNAQGTAPTAGTITLIDTLPNGLSYISANGVGWTCSATGQTVTCTSTTVIAAGAASGNPVTLNVSIAAIAAPTVTNSVTVSGGGEPASNANDNDAYDQTAIQGSGQNALLSDGAQTALPDTVVFYAHRFNAGFAGSVSFATSNAAAPANAAWNNLLYLDTNCNGILDAGEGTSPLSGSIAVNPGDGICLIVKEYVPANAPYGSRDNVTLTATFTPASGPTTTLTRNDITTVGSTGGAGLVLQKSVRNITAGTAAGTNNVAKSGDTLEYVINYTNKGSDGVGSIVLTDATPSFTHFAAASCGVPLPQVITACTVSSQPAVNGTGSISWTLTGTLNSTASGSVTFSVTVD